MEHVIHILITSTLLALIWFFARRNSADSLKNSILTLKYSKVVLFIILTIVSLLPIGGALFFLLKFGIKSNTDLIICVSWLTVFSILGGYIFLRFTKEKIIVDSDKIQAFYPFGKSKELMWKKIDNVTFSEFNKWLVLESKGQNKIRLSILLTGFKEFCEIAKQKTPYNIWNNELEKASGANFMG